jgi:hypothetical protein
LASELVTGKGKTEGDLCHEKYDELKRRWEDANGKVIQSHANKLIFNLI